MEPGEATGNDPLSTCNIKTNESVRICIFLQYLFYHTRRAYLCYFFFFHAEDGIRDLIVTGVQTCALPIYLLVTKQRHVGLGIALRDRVPRHVVGARSEERRVGKECRSSWSPSH